jgi:hypothetical protein
MSMSPNDGIFPSLHPEGWFIGTVKETKARPSMSSGHWYWLYKLETKNGILWVSDYPRYKGYAVGSLVEVKIIHREFLHAGIRTVVAQGSLFPMEQSIYDNRSWLEIYNNVEPYKLGEFELEQWDFF